MKRKTFTFHSSWFEAISNQPDDVRLALMDAICRYAIDGELPSGLPPVAEVAFMLIRAQIDASPARRKARPAENTHTGTTASDIAADRPDAAIRQAEAPSQQPEVPTRQTEAAKPAVRKKPDQFDKSFDVFSELLLQSESDKANLRRSLGICDIETALEEFKEYIISHNQKEGYVFDDLRQINKPWVAEFCTHMIIAENKDHFLSDRAKTPTPTGT